MKITDFAIVFMFLLLTIIVIDRIENNKIFSNEYENEEINRISDNLVTDMLEECYVNIDLENNPVLDENKVTDFLNSDFVKKVYVNNPDVLSGNIKCIVLLKGDRYSVFSNGIWIANSMFSSEIHEIKVKEIAKLMEENIGNDEYRINIPLNSGEAFSQTLPEYGIMLLYKENSEMLNGKKYQKYFLSGAKVRKKIVN